MRCCTVFAAFSGAADAPRTCVRLGRLVQAYNQAAATLNLLRGFSTGGYAGLQRVLQWNLDFMDKSDEGQARAAARGQAAGSAQQPHAGQLMCGVAEGEIRKRRTPSLQIRKWARSFVELETAEGAVSCDGSASRTVHRLLRREARVGSRRRTWSSRSVSTRPSSS